MIFTILSACLSPSDKQHLCSCTYDSETQFVIKGIENFSNLDSGVECGRKCGFRRLLVFFYDHSGPSKDVINQIADNQIVVNTINDNFSFVCLHAGSKESKKLGVLKSSSNKLVAPFFAVINCANKEVVSSLGVRPEVIQNLDSWLMNALQL